MTARKKINLRVNQLIDKYSNPSNSAAQLLCDQYPSNKLAYKEINENKMVIVYAPLEIVFMFKRFLKNFKPKCCIILECDLWPVMITTTYKGQIPLIFAQAQYPEKGFIRDKKFPFLKATLIEKFDLILSKSKGHKERFEYFGAKNVLIMGDIQMRKTQHT